MQSSLRIPTRLKLKLRKLYQYFSIPVLGHCSDTNTGQPPRGLQFTLGTKANPEQFDTIVMANLVSN